MNRRDAGLALLALSAAPRLVFAQVATRIYRVAVVFNGSVDTDRVSLDAFKQGLRQHGYTVGGNLKVAKALGIKIPQAVLLRADRVIE